MPNSPEETSLLDLAAVKREDIGKANAATTIGASIGIVGTIRSSEDIIVAGRLDGAVISEGKVTILSGAEIKGNIIAESVVSYGSVVGNIDAPDRIELYKEARLVGDIKTSRIIIEDGSYFKGSIDIAKRPKTVPLPIIGSSEASRFDEIAEDEIKRGDYTDLEEEVLFRRSPQALTFDATEEFKVNAGW